MENNIIIAHADKTILKISGIKVKGFKPYELEAQLGKRLDTLVRIIGVTGESIEMDIYNLEPEQILKDEEGIVKAVSTIEGVNATEVIRIEKTEKAIPIDISNIKQKKKDGCSMERWLKYD